MKKTRHTCCFLIVLALLFVCKRTFAQAEVEASYQDSVLLLEIQLAPGWFLYGHCQELDPPAVVCEDTAIHFSSLQFQQAPRLVEDKAFSRQVWVYTDEILAKVWLEKYPKDTKMILCTFGGYISNGEIFLPYRKVLRVRLGRDSSATRVRTEAMQATDHFVTKVSSAGKGWGSIFLPGIICGLTAPGGAFLYWLKQSHEQQPE